MSDKAVAVGEPGPSWLLNAAPHKVHCFCRPCLAQGRLSIDRALALYRSLQLDPLPPQ